MMTSCSYLFQIYAALLLVWVLSKHLDPLSLFDLSQGIT